MVKVEYQYLCGVVDYKSDGQCMAIALLLDNGQRSKFAFPVASTVEYNLPTPANMVDSFPGWDGK